MANIHEWVVMTSDGREFGVCAADKESARAKVRLATNGRVEIMTVRRCA